MICTLLFTVAVGSAQLGCALDEDQRVIDYGGESYSDLRRLVAACPELRTPEHRLEFAKIANYLYKGLTYEVIEDVEIYRDEYNDRIQEERTRAWNGKPRLSDYGVFDLTPLHAPRIEDDHVVFYVRHSKTEVPYEVTLPLSENRTKIRYKLLPFS